MTKKYFLFSLAYWIVIALILVFIFNHWPRIANSPWIFLGIFIAGLIGTRLGRRFYRKGPGA